MSTQCGCELCRGLAGGKIVYTDVAEAMLDDDRFDECTPHSTAALTGQPVEYRFHDGSLPSLAASATLMAYRPDAWMDRVMLGALTIAPAVATGALMAPQ